MEKFKKFIMENKGLFVVVVLFLLLITVVGILFISMFFGGSSDRYGNRLEGIEDVAINKEQLEEINVGIEEIEGVEDCSARIQGRIIYFTINYSNDVEVEDAKDIASITLEKFEEDELKYYDISYFLVQTSEEEEGGFVITGNKHPQIDTIGWIQS